MAINKLNIFINGARGKLNSRDVPKKNNVINYYDIFARAKNTKGFVFDSASLANGEFEKLKRSLTNSFNIVNDKEFVKNNPELIRECFEIGCYILYDRQILNEVIEKQKKYETDYVADFFKYVLRIFFKRYDSNFILTKNQCKDIKELCIKLLGVNYYYEECSYIYSISAKDIVTILKDIAI